MALVSSSSAAVAVDKATSDLLIGPDWTMNIDICDSVNVNHWLAKDVVKALKKRLQHKNSKVQLLALTLLETMVKNCGDYIHFQIAEKNILGEMVKIVRKKTDMHVRDKILVLLDSWQEAFGGPGGKHPQYYWAYEELRRSGVEFPQRSVHAAPIFTPPVNHSMRPTQVGYGMPSNSSRRLDETMATEIEGLSLSTLESMRNVMELLSDMLQAVNPDDREAVKDEVIVDLVNHCRSNQKKLMQMLTTTGDEDLLGQGLELNDSLQVLLAKHDAIASGSPIPTQTTYLESKPASNPKSAEVKDPVSSSSTSTPMPVATVRRSYIDEEDEEEDDFAQLARRHSKTQSSPSQTSNGTSNALVPVDSVSSTSTTTDSTPGACNALALVDQPAPLSTMKEQEIIDLLSITLSTSSTTSNQSHTLPSSSDHSIPPAPGSSTQGYPYVSPQTYPGNQGQGAYETYVVPWAQPQAQMPSHSHTPQPQSQPPAQFQPQFQPQFQHSGPQFQPQLQSQPQQFPQSQPQQAQAHQPQPQFQQQAQPQPYHQQQQAPTHQSQPQFQQQAQPQPHHHQQQAQDQAQAHQSQPQFQQQAQAQYPQYSSGYVPPPWAATPGYSSGQRQATNSIYSTIQPNPNSPYSSTAQAVRPMQNNTFPNPRVTNGSSMNGDQRLSTPAPSGQKNFVPSYRLFEDLNVFGNTDGRFNPSPSLSGPTSQGMVGGRK